MKTSQIITQPISITASKKFFAILFVMLSLARVQAQGPVQPEAMQFEPVDVTDVVNLATGDFVYTIPLMSVPGPEGDYPIVLSYHSGIGPNQPATWVGLGWTLNPGAINRTISGYPDDYKNDLVVTHFETESKTERTVSLGFGYGPVGINMNYNIDQGKLGVNSMVSLSTSMLNINLGGFDAGLGLQTSESSGLSWFSSIGASSNGVGKIGANDYVGSISVSAGSQGISMGGGISKRNSTNTNSTGLVSVGASITSSGLNANFSVLGTGFSSVTQSHSGGNVNGFSFRIPIPTGTGMNLSLGYSEWTWSLNETYEELSSGMLYPGTGDKQERDQHDDYLYPSYDMYTASAQGISGVFRSFHKYAFVLRDDFDNDKKGFIDTNWNGNLGVNDISNTSFRFLSDPGYNAVNQSSVGFGNSYSPFDENRVSGRLIEPIIGSDDKLQGFIIEDVDGIIYEFKEAVYNLVQYNESKVDDSGSILQNYSYLNTPYATQWLLSAIKGPDYIDRGSINEVDDQDWGYWVKFEYEKNNKPIVWRAPFNDWGPTTNDKVESFSLGLKEIKYLSSIETSTHKAVFHKSEILRLDLTNSSLDPSADLNHKEKIFEQSTLLNGVNVAGDYVWVGQEALAQDIIANVEYTVELLKYDVDSQPCWTGQFYTDYISKVWDPDILDFRYFAKQIYNVSYSQISLGNYDELSNSTSISFLNAADYDLNRSQACIVEEYWDVGLKFFQYITSGEKYSKQLDHVDLFNKADGTKSLRKISFGYDYSLRPGSAGSIEPENGGSLTLKVINFEGLNNTFTNPPYRFVYANSDTPGHGLNPNYHSYDWDRWGSYRDPNYNESGIATDRGKRKKDTPQNKERADRAIAWNLTGIETPIGSKVLVEYESDDYTFVNDTYEIAYIQERYPIVKYPISSLQNNEVEVDLSTPDLSQILKDDMVIFIFEEERIEGCQSGSGGDPNPPTEYRYQVFPTNTKEPFEVISYQLSPRILVLDRPIEAFKPDDTTSDPYCDYFYSYSFAIVPNEVFGGGTRVKTLITKDGEIEHITRYTYKDGGFSSGVTPSLPTHYSTPNYLVPDVPYKYESAYMHYNHSYDRPSPGILYSKVQVFNSNNSGSKLNGYTEYEFYTARTHPYEEYPVNFTVEDYSGIYGKPKSVTYYEETADGSQFRKVKKDSYEYVFSNNLHDIASVYDDVSFSNVGTLSNPLGVLQSKHIMQWDPTDDDTDNHWERKFDRVWMNVFGINTSVEKYFYADEMTLDFSSKLTTKVRTTGFDMHTGQPLVTVSQSSKDSELLVSKVTPAWWKYPEMGLKNMLTQGFENTVYRASSANISDIDDPDLRNYNFSNNNSQVVSSEVTTWSNHWYNGSYPDIWRKNDTYSFINEEPYSVFPTSYVADTTHSYHLPSLGIPWRMTSNIVRYDYFGHVTESVNQDGTYQTVLYDESNNSLVRAVISNARKNEIKYIDYEEATYAQTGARTGQHFGENRDGIIATAPSILPVFGGGYKAGIWYRSEDNSVINGLSIPATGINEWKFILIKLSPGEQITSSSPVDFDDITIIPEYASISYFAYDPLTWKVTAMTGPDHRTTFFEYDEAGRLILTRNFEGNIISKNDYGYGNEIEIIKSIETLLIGAQVTFTAQSINTNLNIVKYDWSFGDGTGFESASQNTATHTYLDVDEYDLVLTTIDEDGNTRRIIKKIKVEAL